MNNSANKVKLCFVIPSLQAGGMERVMSELLWYFDSHRDLELHLVLYGIKREVFYQIPESATIHRPPFLFNNRYRFFYALKTALFLRKTIKQLKPHSILSFGELWNSFVLISLYGLKVNLYVSDRSQPDKRLSFQQTLLRKFLYPKASGVIVQTELAKKIYQSFLAESKVYVIGNPIRNISGNSKVPKEKIVLSVGRLIHSKHHDILIKIFAQVRRPGWKLLIIGDDALKQQNKARLRKQVAELNAEEFIELLGNQKDVDDYYRRSSIFAFTSSSEGFPNVVGEAMSAGLPVVAFDCVAGPSEMIIDGKTGYLVPLFDEKVFGERLGQLMDDDATRVKFGRNAIKDVQRFAVKTIGNMFFSLMVKGKLNESSSN